MKYYTAKGLRFIGSLLLISSGLVGCATSPVSTAVDLFHNNESELALATLADPEGKIGDEDKLLQLMNQGLISHHQENYLDSQKYFLKAVDLMDEQEQTRISDVMTTLVTTESMGDYKGEYTERLWVHSYLMMNFLVQGDAEGAAVEARQALKILSTYNDALEGAVFTRTLMAMSFEAAGQMDDARIEYDHLKELLADDPNNPVFEFLPSDRSELVLLVAEGDIATKFSSDLFISTEMRITWPQYDRREMSYHQPPLVYESGNLTPLSSVTTDLTSLSSESLASRGTKIGLKMVARAGVKASIANQLEEQDPLLGAVFKVLVFALDTADVRGWDSLPAYLSIYKIPLSPGKHDLEVVEAGLAINEDPNAQQSLASYKLSTQAGQRVFKSLRY